MGFSLEDDLEVKEAVVVQSNVDFEESKNNGINGYDLETEFEFWSIQHPTEPSHEDRPVRCPMPHSSPLITDERMHNNRVLECKKPKASTIVYNESNAPEAIQPPVRTVRKRHHDHTNTIMPLLQMPSVCPHSHNNMNMTFFNGLQHGHRFES